MAVYTYVTTSANAASETRSARSRTPEKKVYVYDTLLERLPQDFEDMALARGQLIQPQEAMVRQGHLPRHRGLAAANHAHLGDGVVGSQERVRGDDGGAPADQAGDAMDPGGLRRLRQAHRRQEGGRRRAGIDVHAPRGPRSRRFGAERLHIFQL
jgi:hypothetical protein